MKRSNEVRVNTAEYAIMHNPGILIAAGLGSCVAIALYDPKSKTGALSHVLLPDSKGRGGKPAKYADTAVDVMLNELMKSTTKDQFRFAESDLVNRQIKERIVAKIAGGAHIFSSMLDVGDKNVIAVKKKLKELGIRLIAEDTGGDRGRTVKFDPNTGKMMIKTVDGTKVI
jgi:chemotaxis protein CheD